jgi:hypothetical protein
MLFLLQVLSAATRHAPSTGRREPPDGDHRGDIGKEKERTRTDMRERVLIFATKP